ncbi:DUF6262 family protein [Mycobacteroides abscessus]|uniref:DUF6262 family protein n=1 Tax=Mycobacteroides abscessus TaxID=36809 RepID=UPI0002EB57B1|nr:DUF6262 family protein [Mycobacteroides abscessus]
MTVTAASQRALNAYSQKRREDVEARIEQAIKRLRRRGNTISVSAVAREAGVSRSVIHRRPALRERINTLQPLAEVSDESPPPATDTENSIVAALRIRLKSKETQISELKAQLLQRDHIIATLHGELARRPAAN